MKHRCSIFSIENTMRPLLRLRLFGKARDGAIMIIGGLMAGLLVAVGGASVDFGLRYVSHQDASIGADSAGISAFAASLHESWGRVPEGSGLEPEVRRRQALLARTYYNLNTRDYPLNPNVAPTFEVCNVQSSDTSGTCRAGGREGDVVRIVIRKSTQMETRFLSLVGVDQLPVRVNSVTDMRNPAESPNFDIVMLLDYTTSMQLPLGTDTRIQALRKSASTLNDYVMCGNEQGTRCDFQHKNRVGMIPYGLTAMGLDPCDLPIGDRDRPDYCRCIKPRGFPGGEEAWERLRGHEGGKPEDCRLPCERVDSENKPASDPFSAYFACPCLTEAPPACGAVIDELQEAAAIIYSMCMPRCTKGNCCPQRCAEASRPRGCVETEMYSYPNTSCCAKPVLGSLTCASNNNTPDDPSDDTGCGYAMGPTPPQTVCCDAQKCTNIDICPVIPPPPPPNPCNATPKPHWCNITPGGGNVGNPGGGPGDGGIPPVNDPCAASPKPDWCTTPPPPPPPPPPRPTFNMGLNQAPQLLPDKWLLAMADKDNVSSLQPALLSSEDPGALFTPVQDANGVWAYSLLKCRGDGPADCRDNFRRSLFTNFFEPNTNSASAFTAFARHESYLRAMRPNSFGDTDRSVNVVIWVTDGENNRYLFPQPQLFNLPKMIPQSEWDDRVGAWQDPTTPQGLAAIKANRYKDGGEYVPERKPDGSPNPEFNAPGVKTAQQWSDEETLAHCRALRAGTAHNQQRPVTIYTVAVGDVAATGPMGAHTRRLMTECSYGRAYGPGEDLPDDRPKLFFAVENSVDLNRAFRTIINSLGNIRIAK